jgi:hypothetical protein
VAQRNEKLDTHLDIYILRCDDDRYSFKQRRKERKYTNDATDGSINDNFFAAISFQLTNTRTSYSNLKQNL